MRRVFLCLFFASLGVPALAQSGSIIYEELDYGAFASPVLRVTTINGEMAMFAGGRAGAIINVGLNPTLLVGAGAYALMNDIKADAVFEDGEERTLEIGYAGLDFEYLIHTRSPVDVSLQFFMGLGSVSYTGKGNALNFSRKDSEDFFVFEPGAGAVLRLNNFIRLSGGITVRTVDDTDRFDGVTNRSMGGLTGVFALDVGTF